MKVLKETWIQFVLNMVLLVFSLSCNESKKEETNAAVADSTTLAKDTISAKPSARPVHWGYEESDGPVTWAKLNLAYAICDAGKSQSPVNLETSAAHISSDLKMNYKPSSFKIAHHEHVEDIVDNGHTIQISTKEGGTISVGGKQYTLRQFHFHTPSEHTLNGRHYPMEMHLVHQDAQGGFAVVGVLLEEGKPNVNFEKIIRHLPNAPGETKNMQDEPVDLNIHIPKDREAYHYIGSLTTPPCLEDVQWFVLRHKVSLSTDQLKAFSSRLHKNNRPVQALNHRKVMIEKIN